MDPVRLIIPACLFLAFSLSHMMAVKSRLREYRVAATSRSIKIGEKLKNEDLRPVIISSSTDLGKTFVLYDERGSELLFNAVKRDLPQGALLNLADLATNKDLTLDLNENEIGIQVPLDELNFAEGQLTLGSHVGFLMEKASATTEYAEVLTGNVANLASTPETVPNIELLEPFRVIGIGDKITAVMDEESSQRSGNQKIITIAVKRDPKSPSLLEKNARRLLQAINQKQRGTERIKALIMLSQRDK